MKHPFDPVYNKDSKILILGSFPSVRSREDGFYYGHPQNRFWKLLSSLFQVEFPQTVQERKTFLLQKGIALWDVIASCDIQNSSDSSIRNVTPNPLDQIFAVSDIQLIITNGKAADRLYRKYYKREAICLPSTSPANATWTFSKLEETWGAALADFLNAF